MAEFPTPALMTRSLGAMSLLFVAACSSGQLAPAGLTNGTPSQPAGQTALARGTIAALDQARAAKLEAEVAMGRISIHHKSYSPRLTDHHTMILADGSEVALPPDFGDGLADRFSMRLAGSTDPACGWTGNNPPPCSDNTGAFRRVYGGPGLSGANATIVGGTFENPSNSTDQGYIYIEGWHAPSTTNSEAGVFLNQGGYYFYTSTPQTGLQVVNSPHFPVGDTMQLFVASGNAGKGFIAVTLWDSSCGKLGDPNCTIEADPDANGWLGNCCIFGRMSTIAQQGDDFTDGSEFGPSVWSDVQQSTGTTGPVNFVPAGYQRYPKDNVQDHSAVYERPKRN